MDQREKFIREINKAFSIGNAEFLLQKISPDFQWVIVGEKTVGGKTEFSQALDQMREMPPMSIDIHKITNAGDVSVVEGIVAAKNKNGQKKYFGFCDIYTFTQDSDLKIKSMTSYVIDVSKHKQYKEHF